MKNEMTNGLISYSTFSGKIEELRTDISGNYSTPEDVNKQITDHLSYLNVNLDKIEYEGGFSVEDKIKLNGIENNANKYVHPDSHSPDIITQDENNRFVTDAEKNIWNEKPNLVTLIDLFYPVGTIYESVVNVNPSTRFLNTTWVEWGKGQVSVGVDITQTEFNLVEKTGGSKTHTLSVTEIPSHTHTQNSHTHTGPSHTHDMSHTHPMSIPRGKENENGTIVGGTSTGLNLNTGVSSKSDTGAAGTGNTSSVTASNNNTGGGGAHNNLQPYITSYKWKRTS